MQSGTLISNINGLMEEFGRNFDDFFQGISQRTEKRSLLARLHEYQNKTDIKVHRNTITKIAEELALITNLSPINIESRLGASNIIPTQPRTQGFDSLQNGFHATKVEAAGLIRSILEGVSLDAYVISIPHLSRMRSEGTIVVHDLNVRDTGQELQFTFGKKFRQVARERYPTMTPASYASYEGYVSLFEHHMFFVGCCNEYREYVPLTISLHNVRPRLNVFCGIQSSSFDNNVGLYTKNVCVIKTKSIDKEWLGFRKPELFGIEVFEWLSNEGAFQEFSAPKGNFFYNRKV